MYNLLLTAVATLNLVLGSAGDILPVTKEPEVKVVEAAAPTHIIWTVKPGDTLKTIAITHYGSEDYWTTIWNDNAWIEDPAYIEIDWVLNLRQNKPENPDELKPELAQKIPAEPVVVEETVPVTNVTVVAAPTAQPAAPVVQPAAVTYAGGPLNDAQIQYLGMCESGMTATRNSGNGYYGAFQFSIGTWNSMGTGYERADLAPLEVQIDAVQRLLSRSSIFTQFPGCARKMQAAGLL